LSLELAPAPVAALSSMLPARLLRLGLAVNIAKYLGASFLKSASKVIGQGARRVEGTGVQPDARGAERPRLLRRLRKHRFADAPPHEFLDEPEVRDLDATVIMRGELEEAGRLAIRDALPNRNVRRREMRRELIVGPRIAVVPMPSVAHRLIQTTIVIRRDPIAAHELD